MIHSLLQFDIHFTEKHGFFLSGPTVVRTSFGAQVSGCQYEWLEDLGPKGFITWVHNGTKVVFGSNHATDYVPSRRANVTLGTFSFPTLNITRPDQFGTYQCFLFRNNITATENAASSTILTISHFPGKMVNCTL